MPVTVTFTVDMSVVASISDDGVHVAGAFQGWDLRVHHSLITAMGRGAQLWRWLPERIQFKFINRWYGRFRLQYRPCRTWATTPTPLASIRARVNPADVTFRVNMAEQTMTAFDTVFVWGSFTGWQGEPHDR